MSTMPPATRWLKSIAASALIFGATMTSALADDAPSHPEAEAAIADSIVLAVAGKFDQWLEKYGIRAHDDWSKNQWKAYQLKQAKIHGPLCLHGDDKDQVIVKRWRGNPDEDKLATAYIECGERLPVPITVQRDEKDNKRFWIYQYSI